MNLKKFSDVAAFTNNKNFEKLTHRERPLEPRIDDVRTEFGRDYTRILHCRAYRRLKHKTQVFFNVKNDHICTRMEHVQHVESVSYIIAQALGLNSELTKAIAIGHDLGHAPFGHAGETILTNIMTKFYGKETRFWHEKNGLHFVDDLETLPDVSNKYNLLNLTYAVRDGIISHCGELDKTSFRPREEFIDLEEFEIPGQYEPVTWEGCVVKFSDKIAYLGRDIEDALNLKIINQSEVDEALSHLNLGNINTTNIIHSLIIDIVKNSSPDKGIVLSEKYKEYISTIKMFNAEHIYKSDRLSVYIEYATLVINSIFNKLFSYYSGDDTIEIIKREKFYYPKLINAFSEWIMHCNDFEKNVFENEENYFLCIIDYISGMTDSFAVSSFNDLITFE